MKTAICPGSFDPVTFGHLNVFRRASAMFDHVTVLVMQNAGKGSVFTHEERCALIRACIGDLPNVTVDSFAGMTTDYTAAHGIDAIVKGVRNTTDFDYEVGIASVLRQFGGPDTVLLPCDPTLAHISTSTGLQLLALGQDVSGFFPRPVLDALEARKRS